MKTQRRIFEEEFEFHITTMKAIIGMDVSDQLIESKKYYMEGMVWLAESLGIITFEEFEELIMEIWAVK